MQIQLNIATQLDLIQALRELFSHLEYKEKIPLFIIDGTNGSVEWDSSLSQKNFSLECAHFFKFAHEGVIPIREVLKSLGYIVTSETIIPKDFFVPGSSSTVHEHFYLEKIEA